MAIPVFYVGIRSVRRYRYSDIAPKGDQLVVTLSAYMPIYIGIRSTWSYVETWYGHDVAYLSYIT